MVEEFLRRSKRRLQPKTISTYRSYLEQFVGSTGGGDATALTLDAGIKWRRDLLHRSDNVARLGTEALRSFAVWCAQQGHRRDPIHGRPVLLGLERTRTTARKRMTLSDEQLDAV